MSITIDGRLLDLPDQDLNKNSSVEFNSIKLGGVTRSEWLSDEISTQYLNFVYNNDLVAQFYAISNGIALDIVIDGNNERYITWTDDDILSTLPSTGMYDYTSDAIVFSNNILATASRIVALPTGIAIELSTSSKWDRLVEMSVDSHDSYKPYNTFSSIFKYIYITNGNNIVGRLVSLSDGLAIEVITSDGWINKGIWN